MRYPSVLALIQEFDGPTMWRVLQPFTELQKRNYPAEWDYNDSQQLHNVAPAFDVYVWPRIAWNRPGDEKRWLKRVRAAGKVVVYETDDDMFHSTDWVFKTPGLWGPNRDVVRQGGLKRARQRFMSRCDGVTVTTNRLRTVAMRYTDKPVVVVPNLIDMDHWGQLMGQAERVVEGPTIGWAGGKRNDEDLYQLAEAWHVIAKWYPDVKFVIQGFLPQILADAVPYDQIVPLPWMPLHKYPLGLVNIDIGCCALYDVSFNRCKSPIKAMEYAAAGAAVVASRVVYEDHFSEDDGILFAETTDEWIAHLSNLLERPDDRIDRATKLARVVDERFSLQRHVGLWVDAWTQIYLRAIKTRVAA